VSAHDRAHGLREICFDDPDNGRLAPDAPVNSGGGAFVKHRSARGVSLWLGLAWFAAAGALGGVAVEPARAQAPVKIAKKDYQIDGLDPGIKLAVREKMAAGTTRFTDDNIVLFLHGATSPSTCDFDLDYKDYSWADWMVARGYTVYMLDYRNYGGSSREPAMEAPAADNKPVTRSYLALRDIEAVVNHIKATRHVHQVTIIGWSWGAMMAGYYASLHSEDVRHLVLYAPLYDFPDHTNLGAGSGLQNKRKPYEFNFAMGAYRVASEAANTARWDGEIPGTNKDAYRDPEVPAEFWKACLATDPTSASRTPPSVRAPNGVLEDSFYQATGRPLWNAANIYAPTLVIGGDNDSWSYPEDREGLMRDLVHAPVKQNVLIKDATHFVIFEKHRFEFFEAILKFLQEEPGH
jgi:pimeloyl-ACP methyl ester carboxylesterase